MTMKVLGLLAILLIGIVALVLAPVNLLQMGGINSSYIIFTAVASILLAVGLTLRQI
jgi:hypothetical protein